jgi:hypothetical protein
MIEEAFFPPYRRTRDGLGPVFILCFFLGTAENTTFADFMFDIKRLMIFFEIGFPFNCHSNIITYPEAVIYHHGQRFPKCKYTSPPHDDTDKADL